jgi:hypothetical protein
MYWLLSYRQCLGLVSKNYDESFCISLAFADVIRIVLVVVNV